MTQFFAATPAADRPRRGPYPSMSEFVIAVDVNAEGALLSGWAYHFPYDEPDSVVAHPCSDKVRAAFQEDGAFKVKVQLVDGVLQLDEAA